MEGVRALSIDRRMTLVHCSLKICHQQTLIAHAQRNCLFPCVHWTLPFQSNLCKRFHCSSEKSVKHYVLVLTNPLSVCKPMDSQLWTLFWVLLSSVSWCHRFQWTQRASTILGWIFQSNHWCIVNDLKIWSSLTMDDPEQQHRYGALAMHWHIYRFAQLGGSPLNYLLQYIERTSICL